MSEYIKALNRITELEGHLADIKQYAESGKDACHGLINNPSTTVPSLSKKARIYFDHILKETTI